MDTLDFGRFLKESRTDEGRASQAATSKAWLAQHGNLDDVPEHDYMAEWDVDVDEDVLFEEED